MSSPHVGGWWRYCGFGLAFGGTRGGNVVRQFSVPYWALAAVCLISAAALLLRPHSTRAGETPAPC